MAHHQQMFARFIRCLVSLVLICGGLFSSSYARADVTNAGPDALATVADATVTSDATYAYINIPYSGTPTWIRVHVDADRNAATGFPVNGLGSSFLIENGRLYAYTGANGAWGWTFVKTVSYAAANGVASMTVSRADLGGGASVNLVTQVDALPASPVMTATFGQAPPPPPPPGGSVAVTYTASTATIANPERGLYRHVGCETPFNQSQLTSFRTSGGESLVLCVFYLRNFVNSAISQATLNLFQQQMTTVRNAGLKAVVRFAYSDNNSPVDATPAMVNTHLTQLAPYLSSNKDVIAVVQAGLVGSWGEWGNTQHYGDSYNMTAKNIADRKAVVDKLLQVVPAERMVQLRMPLFKTKLYSTTVLTAGEAFNGSAKARLGFHNDCFLSNASDYGTYINPAAEYPYLQAETTYLAAGGETCAYVPPRSDCPASISEMTKLHWSYLNLDYNVTVLDAWRKQGCFAQVEQKLGYRFVLKRGTFSGSAKPGGGFAVNLVVENQGWAAPFNSRNVELVFRNTASGALYRVKLAADPRRWLAGQTVTVNETVTLPAAMPKGSYVVLLHLADPQAALHDRPEYAIQVANTGTWEASTGFNNLNHTVGVAP